MNEIEFKALTWIVGGIVLCVFLWRMSGRNSGFEVDIGRSNDGGKKS